MAPLHGLYAITDARLIAESDFVKRVEKALLGGARMLQYRDKSGDARKRLQQARALQQLCVQHDALLIINDDIELALAVNAHGVHLGMDDAPLVQARERLGKDKIIGASCYNQFELARQAAAEGADYIAFGSFFVSTTKPHAVPAELQLLRKARQQLELPVCAIGGISPDNAGPLLKAGADMLAVVSSIFGDTDTEGACRRFCQLFEGQAGASDQD